MSNIGNNPISFLFSQLFWSKQSIKKRFLSRIIKLSFFFFVFIFDPSLKLVLEEHATCRLLWHAEHQSIRRADAQFCRSLWRQAATLPLPIYDSAWEWKGIHLQRARTTTNMHRLSRGEKNRTKTEVHIDRLMQEMVLLLFLQLVNQDYSCNVANIVVEPPSSESSPDSDGCTPVRTT